MKVFPIREVNEAVQYALDGFVALHLHDIVFSMSPRCFRDAVETRRECIAHLFCQNRSKLIRIAKKLGVKIIYIDHDGQSGQHLDLCGAPLRKLLRIHLDNLALRAKQSSVTRVEQILEEYSGCRNWST